MKALTASLTLASVLALSRAAPTTINSTAVPGRSGLCHYASQQAVGVIGGFVPQCDLFGDFLPRQCCPSSGTCWCVNIITGEEIPNTRTPPGGAPVDCSACHHGYYCPEGWSRFEKRCFMFVDSPKTWAEAEKYCLFHEAHLASVHGPKEQHFLQALTRGDTHDFPETWIGCNDVVYLTFWMWSDGSMFDYEYWDDDYITDRKERCLMINYGYHKKWFYYSCDDKLPFICAKLI